jgi:hypothetical protein
MKESSFPKGLLGRDFLATKDNGVIRQLRLMSDPG